jgi:colanic acid biosynthesis glycosyl transferase WcaI
MHIMFMAQCYAPEDVSAAVLITELATDLAKRGHRVTMVTGAPNYPHGRVFEGYRNRLYSAEMLEGVRVIRTWSYISPAKKTLPRLLHYGTYSATAFYGALLAGKPDMLVSFSPPLPLGLSAWLLSRLWQVPWVLQIEDLYPDAAVAAGVMVNKKVIEFFSAMEKFLYKHAHRISVISESFRCTLLSKGVPASKMEVIPVWADPKEVLPLPKQNSFRHKHHLGDKFVVMYAGNIGLTSCLEDVLGAAEILKCQSDIQFVIVGEGVKKERLEAEARTRALHNVLFLPYQPREIFPEMLAAADIGLVTLNKGATLSSLPSKIFNIMASARPVLSVAPPESEQAHMVHEADCGRNVEPGSPERMAEVITLLKAEESALNQMGQHGRAYLEKYHTRQHCVGAYESMLMELCSRPRIKTPSVQRIP